jgi:CheY-like chemotaxis protein
MDDRDRLLRALSGIAHDLNNVLAPILMSVPWLKDGEQDPERLETLREVERSAQRGAELVRRMLDVFTSTELAPAGVAAPPASAPIDLGAVPAATNAMVLVVDDEEGIRQMARRTLERHGYRVTLASNGAEAVEMYGQHRGDIGVVVTDMSMPVMDGATAIAHLREIDPDVRIVASSGLSSGGISRAAGAGSVLFIPKPYTAEVLLRAVGAAMGQRGTKPAILG